jgi:hypothetical protein
MFPTPKGYISIPDAVDRVSRALHGDTKEIPWQGEELDQDVLHSGRKRTTEAQDWLVAALSAGRLVAEIGNIEVPAEYWTCYGAHTTAHTGLLQPPEISAEDYAEIAYQPCFIERSAFEKQLSKIHGSRGRKPGDGTIDDSDHLDRMADLLKTGKAKSHNDAARIVAEAAVKEAAHPATVESIQKRLRDKYKNRHF